MAQTISITKFKNEKDNYENNVRSNNQTLSVWFDADELLNYLNAAKQEALNLDIDNFSGFRIYFIAEQSTKNPMTVAFCPTYEDMNSRGASQHISFDPKYSTRSNPKDLHELLANPPSQLASSIFNQGQACPPYCPER